MNAWAFHVAALEGRHGSFDERVLDLGPRRSVSQRPHDQSAGAVPTGLVEDEHGMGVRSDLSGQLGEEAAHGGGGHRGQDQRHLGTSGRLDGSSSGTLRRCQERQARRTSGMPSTGE